MPREEGWEGADADDPGTLRAVVYNCSSGGLFLAFACGLVLGLAHFLLSSPSRGWRRERLAHRRLARQLLQRDRVRQEFALRVARLMRR